MEQLKSRENLENLEKEWFMCEYDKFRCPCAVLQLTFTVFFKAPVTDKALK